MSAPITPEEQPFLDALGRQVYLMRTEEGLSRAKLGAAAELGEWQIYAIEKGIRRTRRSTLTRLVAVLCDDLDDEEKLEVLEMLVADAGPALAGESKWAHKQANARARRRRRKAAIERRAVELLEERWARAHQSRQGHSG